MISLKGLQIKKKFLACTRNNPGHVDIQLRWVDQDEAHTNHVDHGGDRLLLRRPSVANVLAKSEVTLSQEGKHLEGVEVFNGFASIPMTRIMHGDFSTTRDIEVYLLDILEDKAKQGILGIFNLWQSRPSLKEKTTRTLLMVQPCQEIDIFKAMQKTYIVEQDEIDGGQLQALFVRCFDKAKRRRSCWGKTLAKVLLRPPSKIDIETVSKLAAMFIMEHLAVTPKIDHSMDESQGLGLHDETGQRMLKLEESISAVENKVGLVLAKLDEDSKSRTQICTVLEMQKLYHVEMMKAIQEISGPPIRCDPRQPVDSGASDLQSAEDDVNLSRSGRASPFKQQVEKLGKNEMPVPNRDMADWPNGDLRHKADPIEQTIDGQEIGSVAELSDAFELKLGESLGEVTGRESWT
jgi:hypothetical protein